MINLLYVQFTNGTWDYLSPDGYRYFLQAGKVLQAMTITLTPLRYVASIPCAVTTLSDWRIEA